MRAPPPLLAGRPDATITCRSPLHASLAHARTAVGLAHGGEAHAALRCLGRAENALAKTDLTQPRSSWIAFYGPAELHSLTAIVPDVVRHPAQAEAASHRPLAALLDTYLLERLWAPFLLVGGVFGV
ncbi:hypothetical protein [Streptomyces sp. 6N223]|uniref:hypothetical protein n=1 Tax=Streptomyces sp. 6N223 TaxID=3457412 RepID=UPI003FD19B26